MHASERVLAARRDTVATHSDAGEREVSVCGGVDGGRRLPGGEAVTGGPKTRELTRGDLVIEMIVT